MAGTVYDAEAKWYAQNKDKYSSATTGGGTGQAASQMYSTSWLEESKLN